MKHGNADRQGQELSQVPVPAYLRDYVYFCTTTPVLVAIFTSGTYVAKMRAVEVFTCIALFNMIFNPLNAFPWDLSSESCVT